MLEDIFQCHYLIIPDHASLKVECHRKNASIQLSHHPAPFLPNFSISALKFLSDIYDNTSKAVEDGQWK